MAGSNFSLRHFIPPQIEGDFDKQQIANMLHVMLLCIAATALTAFLFFGLFVSDFSNLGKVMLMTGLTFGIATFCYFLLQRQKVDLAARIVVGVFVVGLVLASAFENGMLSSEIDYLVVPIAIAYIAIGPRWGVAASIISLLSLVSIALLNIQGIIPAPPVEPTNIRVLETTMHRFMIMLTFSIYFYASKRAIDQSNRHSRASAKRIRQMLDLMPDAALQLSLDGTIRAINQRSTMVLGYEADDLVGKSAAILSVGRRPEQVAAAISAMAFNDPVVVQFPIQAKDGRKLIGERRSVKLNIDGDELVFTIIRDITEDMRTREQLATSQLELAVANERLALVANNVPAMMAFVDAGENVLFLNRAFVELGIDPQRGIGKKISNVLAPKVYGYMQPFLEATANSSEPVRYDIPVSKPNGEPAVIDTVHIPLSSAGEYSGYIALGMDVTDERRLTRELKESERRQQESASRLQLVADNIPARLSYVNSDLEMLFANEPFKKILNTRFENWVGLRADKVSPPDIWVQCEPHLLKALEGNQVTFEYTVGTPGSNRYRITQTTYVPDFDHDDVVGVFTLSQDVTEDRKREAALRESQRLESLGLMAGGIAHDFNNLLVAILGQASIAKMKVTSDHPAHRHIDKSVRAAERARSLTNQMLAYSGRGQFEIRAVNFNDLIKHNLHLFESTIGKNVRLQTNFEPNLPIIEADTAQMQQVVMNLIINAAQAIGDAPGVITLVTKAEEIGEEMANDWHYVGSSPEAGHYVTFEIRDNGCGMSLEQTSKIFEPFYSTKEQGSGLGLSAVLGIIRGHNGGIYVSSEIGVGSRFQLMFPVSPAWQDGVGQASVNPAASKNWTLDNKTVLVIDDEAQVAETVSDMLDLKGIRCIKAIGGISGLRLYQAQQAQIDLVLLDLMMPEMDGEETLQRLRELDPNVNVIITSGYSESDATKRFVGQDLTGFIQKPYRPDQLFERVVSALKRDQTVVA